MEGGSTCKSEINDDDARTTETFVPSPSSTISANAAAALFKGGITVGLASPFGSSGGTGLDMLIGRGMWSVNQWLS